MFEITELAKKFSDDFNNNRNMVIKAVNSFIFNVPEITGLDEEAIEEIGKIIGYKSSIDDCWCIFGTMYNLKYVSNFLNDRDYYYIADTDIRELSVYLKYNQKEVGVWIPIIFIREFWDFYSVYTAGNRKETKKEIEEETNNEQNTSTKICNILDNATELNHIRSSLENLNLHYNEICEILEAIVKKLY